MDELCDASGRAVLCILVGVLDGNSYNRPLVVHLEDLEEGVNSSTVAQAFNNAMKFIWPTEIPYGNVLLLLTDGASYMIKAGVALQRMYPKLIHLTCKFTTGTIKRF